jgi:hypothetical protein
MSLRPLSGRSTRRGVDRDEPARDDHLVGRRWVTTVFEFCFGHYVVGDSCADLLRDYNVLKCRMWGMFILWVDSLAYVFYEIEV